jgi:hypothetical protein
LRVEAKRGGRPFAWSRYWKLAPALRFAAFRARLDAQHIGLNWAMVWVWLFPRHSQLDDRPEGNHLLAHVVCLARMDVATNREGDSSKSHLDLSRVKAHALPEVGHHAQSRCGGN